MNNFKHLLTFFLGVSFLISVVPEEAIAEQIISDVKRRQATPYKTLSSSESARRSGTASSRMFGNTRPNTNFYEERQLAYYKELDKYERDYQKWSIKTETQRRKAQAKNRAQQEKEYQKRLQEWRKEQSRIAKASPAKSQGSILDFGGKDTRSTQTSARSDVQDERAIEWKDSPRSRLTRRPLTTRDETGKLIAAEDQASVERGAASKTDFWTKLKGAFSSN